MLSAKWCPDDSGFGRNILKVTQRIDRQNCCCEWWHLFFTPKSGRKKPPKHKGWDAEILYGTKSSEIFPFWTNQNVSFTFGLTLRCTSRLWWSCTSSLLVLAACDPGWADLQSVPREGCQRSRLSLSLQRHLQISHKILGTATPAR